MTIFARTPVGRFDRPVFSSSPANGNIWLITGSDETDALIPEIKSYGYLIQNVDPSRHSLIGIGTGAPDVIMIEAGLDDPSLISWVRDAAALAGRPGVLVLDAGLDSIDRIVALEAGADDCVAWPCATREIVARIRAISRRWRPSALPLTDKVTAQPQATSLSFAGWTLDRDKRRLGRPRQPSVTLPMAEFAVLDELLRSPRCIVARKTLLEATTAHTEPETRGLRAVDIQISRLRRKLEIDGAEIIRTVRGRGYMLISSVASA